MPKFIPATLIKRQNRFVANCLLASGEQVQAHCPNTGPMLGLAQEQEEILLSKSDNPKRKLQYTWEVSFDSTYQTYVGINTHATNKIVKQALHDQTITINGSPLSNIRAEVKINDASRLDFSATDHEQNIWYIEVKNCHLKRDANTLEFPDTITTRGAKHLRELVMLKAQGYNCAMIYVGQRCDINSFKIASDLDEEYYQEFVKAVAAGVQILAYGCDVDIARGSIKLLSEKLQLV
jgi:sugar fermentation stimulation protein A